MYEPHLPESFKVRLVQAMKEVHLEMMEPPERIKGNEEKMKRWKPPVKKDIDWEGVINAGGGQVGSVVGGATVPKPQAVNGEGDELDDAGAGQEPEFLTIGLIGESNFSSFDSENHNRNKSGQPNVGKSSLLNALFGAHKVRASKTPGKVSDVLSRLSPSFEIVNRRNIFKLFL
jgi:predicted GTPase